MYSRMARTLFSCGGGRRAGGCGGSEGRPRDAAEGGRGAGERAGGRGAAPLCAVCSGMRDGRRRGVSAELGCSGIGSGCMSRMLLCERRSRLERADRADRASRDSGDSRHSGDSRDCRASRASRDARGGGVRAGLVSAPRSSSNCTRVFKLSSSTVFSSN